MSFSHLQGQPFCLDCIFKEVYIVNGIVLAHLCDMHVLIYTQMNTQEGFSDVEFAIGVALSSLVPPKVENKLLWPPWALNSVSSMQGDYHLFPQFSSFTAA